jgi:hypothetical protein
VAIPIIWALILVCVATFSTPLEAKIYIWTDENSRTHYCNDPDDVPKEYKEKCRTIESQAARSAPSPEKTNVSALQPSVQPPSAPQREGEMEELLKEYREKRRAIQEYRRQNPNLQTAEYEELKRQLNEIKLRLGEKKPRSPAPN